MLPAATARKLRGLNPARWQAAFDQQFQGVLAQYEDDIGAGALDTAWGLTALDESGLPHNPTDNRFLPNISRQMRAGLLNLLSAQPSGLMQARRQLHQWLLNWSRNDSGCCRLQRLAQQVTVKAPGLTLPEPTASSVSWHCAIGATAICARSPISHPCSAP